MIFYSKPGLEKEKPTPPQEKGDLFFKSQPKDNVAIFFLVSTCFPAPLSPYCLHLMSLSVFVCVNYLRFSWTELLRKHSTQDISMPGHQDTAAFLFRVLPNADDL